MAMQIIENEVVDIINTTNNNSDINTLNDDYIETQLKILTQSERYVERQLKTALEDSAFIATPEWQEIGEGPKVPSGVHYRMNLETGKKEAKLLETEDETDH